LLLSTGRCRQERGKESERKRERERERERERAVVNCPRMNLLLFPLFCFEFVTKEEGKGKREGGGSFSHPPSRE
jgi:hypothetical protein